MQGGAARVLGVRGSFKSKLLEGCISVHWKKRFSRFWGLGFRFGISCESFMEDFEVLVVLTYGQVPANIGTYFKIL